LRTESKRRVSVAWGDDDDLGDPGERAMSNGKGSGPRRVRVAFVERYAMVVESFAVAVREVCTPYPLLVQPGSTAVAIAGAVLAVRPDIAVLHLDNTLADLDLPIEQLARAGVTTTVLTDTPDDARLGDFILRGAEAALSTEIGLQRLVNVIERVAARQPAMEPSERERLRTAAHTADRTATGGPVDRLSVREGQVLRHLMAGLGPAQIARRDFVSEATVRTQVRSILGKLGVGSQLAAVAIAYQAGWRPAGLKPLAGFSA
jgi:DNA-binding NarL/FixJ family response regulator